MGKGGRLRGGEGGQKGRSVPSGETDAGVLLHQMDWMELEGKQWSLAILQPRFYRESLWSTQSRK